MIIEIETFPSCADTASIGGKITSHWPPSMSSKRIAPASAIDVLMCCFRLRETAASPSNSTRACCPRRDLIFAGKQRSSARWSSFGLPASVSIQMVCTSPAAAKTTGAGKNGSRSSPAIVHESRFGDKLAETASKLATASASSAKPPGQSTTTFLPRTTPSCSPLSRANAASIAPRERPLADNRNTTSLAV